jgi:transposase
MVMTFVNGDLQARFMARIRGLDPQRCLFIPLDVGKAIAVALVADHYGEIVVAPFEFALIETGFAVLSTATTRSQHERDALVEAMVSLCALLHDRMVLGSATKLRKTRPPF